MQTTMITIAKKGETSRDESFFCECSNSILKLKVKVPKKSSAMETVAKP